MRKLLLSLSLLVLGSFIPSVSARGGMPDPVTPSGQIIEGIYYQIFIAGVSVFVLVFALLVFVIWRYREGSGHGRATFEKEREHLGAELTWTIVPLFLVAWIGWIAYGGLVDLDDNAVHEDFDMEIGITAFQYDWQADYGDGIMRLASPDASNGSVADSNVFLVPADTEILFTVTSEDVIHSFYIQDSNGGPVGMVDANPTGPAKYNHLKAEFPEGEYYVQCKEMCLNPGHAYMRARIQSVPQAEFDHWRQCASVEVGADRIDKIQLTVDASGLSSPSAADGNLTIVKGGRLVAEATNMESQSVTINVQGGEGGITLGPGESACFGVDAPDPAMMTLTSDVGGNPLNVEVIDAEVVNVIFREYIIEFPVGFQAEAGKTYLFTAENLGAQPHNLFIGEYNNGQVSTLVAGPTVAPGATGSVVAVFDQPMTFDWWCNIAGHVGLGMIGEADFTVV